MTIYDFWLVITVVTSFIGQGALGVFLLKLIQNRWFPPEPSVLQSRIVIQQDYIDQLKLEKNKLDSAYGELITLAFQRFNK